MPDLAEQLALDFKDGLVRIMLRYYPVIAQQAFEAASGALDVDVAFDLDNPKVQEVLGELLSKISKDVPETLKEAIRSLIGRQADEGWSVERLASEIAEHAGDWSKNRARMVAHTEVASAFERANTLAWRESGVVDGKGWLLGPSPCPDCEPLGGKEVGLDDEFAPGVLHPPFHPLCTCAAYPVVKPL